MFFMKEYRPNSHVRSYSVPIFIFIYYFSWPGARSQYFDILALAPAPAKSSSSLQLRLHNTGLNSRQMANNLLSLSFEKEYMKAQRKQ